MNREVVKEYLLNTINDLAIYGKNIAINTYEEGVRVLDKDLNYGPWFNYDDISNHEYVKSTLAKYLNNELNPCANIVWEISELKSKIWQETKEMMKSTI